MLRRIYDWCIDAADKPYALWIMAAVSFAESSFFPIPPDVMLLPMSLARPKRAWFFATICTVTSVAGGVVGYAIGALLYNSLGQWLMHIYGLTDKVETFRAVLCRMGRGHHPAEGADADPLQARHHHVGVCRLQHLAVHPVLDRRARRHGSSCWPCCSTATATSFAPNWKSGLACGSRIGAIVLVLGFVRRG